MSITSSHPPPLPASPDETPDGKNEAALPIPPLPNYTLSTVCPACGMEMFRLACKVRCGRCGFMWDCSEV